MINALGHQGFVQIGLTSERGFGGLPRLFPQGVGGLEIYGAVAARIDV